MDFVSEFTPLNKRYNLEDVLNKLNLMHEYVFEYSICRKGDEIDYIYAKLDKCKLTLQEMLQEDFPKYIDNMTFDKNIVDIAFLLVLVADSYNVCTWWGKRKGFYIRD